MLHRVCFIISSIITFLLFINLYGQGSIETLCEIELDGMLDKRMYSIYI